MSAFNRSFISAMPTGAKMYNDSLANERAAEQLKIQQAGEARTAADYERKVGIDKQVDERTQQLLSPNKGNYGLSAPTQFAPQEISSAMPMAEQADAAAGLQVGGVGLTDGMKLGGAPGMSARAPLGSGAGLQPSQQLGIAPPAKAPVLTNNKKPERGDASRILGEIAMLKGDHEGYGRHAQSAADFDFEDGFNGHMKGFNGGKEQVAPLVGYINEKTRASLGAEEKGGFRRLSVVNEGGEASFAKLSRQDQAKLYAAHMMMDTNPSKAMQIMQGVNKDLAAAIAADTNLYGKVADNNNDATSKEHTAQYHRDVVELRRQENAATAEYRKKSLAQSAKADGDPAIRKAYTDTAIQMQALAPTPANEAKRAELLNNLEMLRLRFDASRGVLPNPDNFGTQKGGNGKPVEVPDAGKQVLLNGRIMITDGNNGYYAKGSGRDEPEFKKVLRDATLADSATSTNAVTRDKYGEFAIFNGFKYPINDPSAVQKLVRDYDAYVTDTPERNRRGLTLDPRDAMAMDPKLQERARMDERAKNAPAFARVPNDGRPSIYDSPEKWKNWKDPQGQERTPQQLGLSGLLNNRDPRYNTVGAVR